MINTNFMPKSVVEISLAGLQGKAIRHLSAARTVGWWLYGKKGTFLSYDVLASIFLKKGKP